MVAAIVDATAFAYQRIEVLPSAIVEVAREFAFLFALRAFVSAFSAFVGFELEAVRIHIAFLMVVTLVTAVTPVTSVTVVTAWVYRAPF